MLNIIGGENLCLDNTVIGGIYWTSEVVEMVDKDMLEAIGQMLAEQSKQMTHMMDARLDPIKQDLAEVKQRTTKIEVALENDVHKTMSLLLEGQKGMNEKFKQLDQVAEDVEEIKIKVSALESVTRDNVTQIKELRKAN